MVQIGLCGRIRLDQTRAAIWAGPVLAVARAMIYPLLKFAVLSAVVVPLCFVTGSLLRRLPYADRVL